MAKGAPEDQDAESDDEIQLLAEIIDQDIMHTIPDKYRYHVCKRINERAFLVNCCVGMIDTISRMFKMQGNYV